MSFDDKARDIVERLNSYVDINAMLADRQLREEIERLNARCVELERDLIAAQACQKAVNNAFEKLMRRNKLPYSPK